MLKNPGGTSRLLPCSPVFNPVPGSYSKTNTLLYGNRTTTNLYYNLGIARDDVNGGGSTFGYRFGTRNGGPTFELPGLWFNPEEILALMSMYQMLEGTDESGLLGRHIKPLMTRLQALMDAADDSANEILKRVKLISVQRRRVEPKHFETIGAALVKRSAS